MNEQQPITDESSSFTFDQNVGRRIRSAREALELTQGAVCTRTRVADPAGKGISRTALVGYESGSSRPGLREIKLLCEILAISPSWLIYGSDTPFQTALPSLAMVRTAGGEFRDAIRLGFAIAALKGHERDALSSLALSLAGRQLGDFRLSGLLSYVGLLGDEIEELVRKSLPEGVLPQSPEELMDILSQGMGSNWGNKLVFNDDGELDEKKSEWTYIDPKSENQTNS